MRSWRLAMRTLSALGLLIALAPAQATAAGLPRSTRPRVSFVELESDLMCGVCHESLLVANAPEAYSERQYLRDLIADGLNQRQVLNGMVAAYGTAVLAKPPASGFNLLVYVLPPALVALGLAILLYTLPRWRRRTRAANAAAARAQPPPLPEADAARLEQDLARHEAY